MNEMYLHRTIGLVIGCLAFFGGNCTAESVSGVTVEQAQVPDVGNGRNVHEQHFDETSKKFEELLAQAAEYQSAGQLKKTFALLTEGRHLADRGKDLNLRASILGRISDAYLLSRYLDEAVESARQSVTLARRAKTPRLLASALTYLGNAHAAQEAFPAATRCFEEAMGLASQSHDPETEVAVLLNSTKVQAQDTPPRLLLDKLNRTHRLLVTLPTSRQKVYDLIATSDFGLALQQPGDREYTQLQALARKTALEAQAVAENLEDPRARAYALGHLGGMREETQQYREAYQLFQEALFFAEQADAPEIAGRLYWQLGKVHRAVGQRSEAKSYFRRAIAAFGEVRSALVFGDRGLPGAFRASVGRVYLDLVELLIEDSIGQSNAVQISLQEVRAVMEDFKLAELQNYFRDDCFTESRKQGNGVNLDGLLEPGSASLYPILLTDRLVLLLGLANGNLSVATVPVRLNELRSSLASFREQLSSNGNPRRLRTSGAQLYEWLIKPLEVTLSKHRVTTIVVVPDDSLRTVPLGALYDGKDFLVRRFAFAVSPSLSLTRRRSSDSSQPKILLGGVSEGMPGFSRLPYVTEEINQVAALFPDRLELLNDDFRKDRVASTLSGASFSHILFATHTEVYRDPRRSYLMTRDGKISMDELESYVAAGRYRHRPVDVMVLSACSTAEGDERAALGLAGVAVKAGASSVMASLWQVTDASTSRLVPKFFEYLRDSKVSRPQALQQAQLALLADPEFKHPYYWAPFMLIGDWH